MHTASHSSPELAPVPFQLLGRRPCLPSGPDWLFERKFDGYRAQIVSRGGLVRVFTRGFQDWTHRVPHIVAAAAALGCDFTLDGEIAATATDGRTDLSWLSDPLGHDAAIVFHAFDILHLHGSDLLDLALAARKVLLSRLIARSDFPVLQEVAFVSVRGQQLLEDTRELGHEGIVAKKVDAPYHVGERSDAWLKFKNRRSGTFRVAGWQLTPKGTVSSLLLATHASPSHYCGRVGTGFTSLERAILISLLPESSNCPLKALPARSICAAAKWSDLTIVVEVQYLETSANGILREPIFKAVAGHGSLVHRPDGGGRQRRR